MSVQHLIIVAVASTGMEIGYETLWWTVFGGRLQSDALFEQRLSKELPISPRKRPWDMPTRRSNSGS